VLGALSYSSVSRKTKFGYFILAYEFKALVKWNNWVFSLGKGNCGQGREHTGNWAMRKVSWGWLVLLTSTTRSASILGTQEHCIPPNLLKLGISAKLLIRFFLNVSRHDMLLRCLKYVSIAMVSTEECFNMQVPWQWMLIPGSHSDLQKSFLW
jgi:hypothetical protein